MKVIKVGGGCLKGEETIGHILNLIAERGRGQIFVVSALNGVTDMLIQAMSEALEDEENIPVIINRLRDLHLTVTRHLIECDEECKEFDNDFNASLRKLERLYYGLNFTKEITPRMRDIISSFGERFAVELLSYTLRCRGMQATYLMPHKIGLITDGKFGDATANISKVTKNFQKHVKPVLNGETILFIPGFFGVSERGDITTFGRGGSDYSAAVVAVAMQAEVLEIWKDVAGFMSADPKFVSEARLIPVLSYEEAAELAYFGAKILHPRTIEPVRKKKVRIAIKSIMNPDAAGTLITTRNSRFKDPIKGVTHNPDVGVLKVHAKSVIKSVAHDPDIGILKIHASGVGARPGILGHIANHLAESGINIKSVVTSQTCISLLLTYKDLDAAHHVLKSMKPTPYQRIEKLVDVALVGIVGEGLLQRKGIAAQCFTAVAKCGVNIEMISFGPSRAALYCLVRNRDLHNAVNAIHNTFFSTQKECKF